MTMTEEVVMKRLLLMMMEWMFVTLIMTMMKKMMILFTCFRVAFTSSGFMPALMHLSYLTRLNQFFLFLSPLSLLNSVHKFDES